MSVLHSPYDIREARNILSRYIIKMVSISSLDGEKRAPAISSGGKYFKVEEQTCESNI